MVAIRDTSGSHEDGKYNNSRVMTYSSAVCSVLIHLVVSWCIHPHCGQMACIRYICFQVQTPSMSWTYQSHMSAMSQNQGGAQVIFSYVKSEFFTNNSGELPLHPHHIWWWHNTHTPNNAAVKIHFKTHLYHRVSPDITNNPKCAARWHIKQWVMWYKSKWLELGTMKLNTNIKSTGNSSILYSK